MQTLWAEITMVLIVTDCNYLQMALEAFVEPKQVIGRKEHAADADTVLTEVIELLNAQFILLFIL